jgi:hypothetical protein
MRGLESFAFNKDLVGRDTTRGLVPKALRPIFRDREDFSVGDSLTEATIGQYGLADYQALGWQAQLSGLERSNADFCGAPAPKRESKQRRPVANHV